MFFTIFAMDVVRVYQLRILWRDSYAFVVRLRGVAAFLVVAARFVVVLRLVAVARFVVVRFAAVVRVVRRALLVGAAARSSMACSWVTSFGSTSFGILAFFVPSVMYGP